MEENIRMKNTLRLREILKSLIVMVVFAIFAVVPNIKVYGADFNASVSSGEVTQGENITVTVTMNSGATVGAYDLALTYDANILEYVSGADGGGGGSLRLYNDSNYTTSYTVTITFKAIAAGSTKISVLKQGDICDIDLNDLTLKASDGTVTVKAPATASSNANLSSLSLMAVRADGWSGSVSLMPDFSKDVTSYQLWLGSEFNKLSISAVPEDSKAKVATSGTDLKAGQDNTATITVTAEDGTVKTYTVIVHVKAETNTEGTTAPENNNTDTPIDTPTEGPADNPQDTTTGNDNPSGADDRNVTISEKPYTVLDVPEDLELPEGFERKAVSWNGIEVIGASDQSGTLILLYLQNNESSESRFYVYNSEKSSYTAFMSYTITQRSYVMLMADDDLIFEGEKAAESNILELTTLNVAGDYVDAYKLKNTENIYIVKAMNWDNKIGYYYYNTIDGSMTPYFETVVKQPDSNGAQPVTNSAKESNMTELLFWILVGLSVVLVLIIVVLVVNVRRLSAGNREADEEYDDEEYDDDEYDDNNDDDRDDKYDDRNNGEKEEASEEKASDEMNEANVINKAEKINDIDEKNEEIMNKKIEENKKEEQSFSNPEKGAEAKKIVEDKPAKKAVKEAKPQKVTEEKTTKKTESYKTIEENPTKESEAHKTAEKKLTKESEVQEKTAEKPTEKKKTEEITEERSAEKIADKTEVQTTADKTKKEKTETSKNKETAAESDIKNKNTAEQKDENMSEKELDSAIDDILGQLFK